MAEQTCYERNHSFNWLTSWLHSFRYKEVVSVADDLAKTIRGRPIRILDIGCAHAKPFGLLHRRISIKYIGIELDESHARVARTRFGGYDNFQIICGSAADEDVVMNFEPDLVIALETFEHIPEHDVVRIVERIAKMNPRCFVSSVPVEIGPAIWLKNVGSWMSGYMRHREYTWLETLWAGLYQLDRLPPHDIGHKGFDWRWLAQTIRHNFQIEAIRRFPLKRFPAALSTTLFFVARPRDSDSGRRAGSDVG